MKSFIRKLINKNGYGNKTELLLKYRQKTLMSDGVKRFYYLHRYNALLRFFSCDIPIEVTIGENLTLPHGGNGIFISRGAEIGKNCVIFQQVTIGSNTLRGTKHPGVPKIGDNVYIGAGAKIIGRVVVGSNVRIGANAVIVNDVPDNCTVVMGSVRVIEKETENNNEFICF